jgi:hypothetical protein
MGENIKEALFCSRKSDTLKSYEKVEVLWQAGMTMGFA